MMRPHIAMSPSLRWMIDMPGCSLSIFLTFSGTVRMNRTLLVWLSYMIVCTLYERATPFMSS